MVSANSERFTCFFSSWVPFPSFPSLIALARASNAMLKRTVRVGPCLIPDRRGIILSFSPLNMVFDVILVFLSLLNNFLCPNTWSILENVPCALEKNVFCSFWMECFIYSFRSIWFHVSLKANVSLLIFCLNYLSIDVSEVYKSLTITVLLSISPFLPLNNYNINGFILFGVSMLCAYILIHVVPFWWIMPLIIIFASR